MPSLHLCGVSYAHTTGAALSDAVDLDVAAPGPRWTGIVGANGAGKTTLLRLLSDELTPTTGGCHAHSDGPPLLVPQCADDLTPSISRFATSWDGLASRLGEALAAWPGACPLVTHDDHLATAVATARWWVTERRVTVGPAAT